jgi:hypothetical protein
MRSSIRKGIGCLFLFGSSVLAVTMVGAIFSDQVLHGGVGINGWLVAAVFGLAFVGYCLGLVLLTAIDSDPGPRSSRLPWRRKATP